MSTASGIPGSTESFLVYQAPDDVLIHRVRQVQYISALASISTRNANSLSGLLLEYVGFISKACNSHSSYCRRLDQYLIAIIGLLAPLVASSHLQIG